MHEKAVTAGTELFHKSAPLNLPHSQAQQAAGKAKAEAAANVQKRLLRCFRGIQGAAYDTPL